MSDPNPNAIPSGDPSAAPSARTAQRRPRFLIISQVYVPDPASVGQHMHDAAAEMVRRGYDVIVYASANGYDDPSRKYAKREMLDGVDIRRVPFSSFGKSSIAIRLLGGFSFVLQVILRGLFVGRVKGMLVSTSPPMAPIAAVVLRFFKRAPITHWAMDINPDQMVAMGMTTETSLPARAFDFLNRMILKRAAYVVALDRFMAATLERKIQVGERMVILPPWPHTESIDSLDHADNDFRAEHDLADKFVFMYSGNISPAHPLDTLLEAAKRLDTGDNNVLLLFIGAGLGLQRVKEFAAQNNVSNIRTLPFQPLDRIRYSLSAADVHLVSMGNEMVGIVHPCKIYGAMSVHRPVLLLGPSESHAGEIVEGDQVGWIIEHGDVDGAEKLLREIAQMSPDELKALGGKASHAVDNKYGKPQLRGAFCDTLEKMMA